MNTDIWILITLVLVLMVAKVINARVKKLKMRVNEIVHWHNSLVQCEHTKLLGQKQDMVEKTVRSKGCGWMGELRYVEKEIYFSQAFAPEWDIKDMTSLPSKYYKIIKEKEEEVIIKNK